MWPMVPGIAIKTSTPAEVATARRIGAPCRVRKRFDNALPPISLIAEARQIKEPPRRIPNLQGAYLPSSSHDRQSAA